MSETKSEAFDSRKTVFEPAWLVSQEAKDDVRQEQDERQKLKRGEHSEGAFQEGELQVAVMRIGVLSQKIVRIMVDLVPENSMANQLHGEVPEMLLDAHR